MCHWCYFSHHGEYSPSHICPNPLCWDPGQWWTDTGNIELRWATDAVQPCDEDNDNATRTWHDNDPTVRCNDDVMTVHGNDNTWQCHDQDTGQWGNHNTWWPGDDNDDTWWLGNTNMVQQWTRTQPHHPSTLMKAWHHKVTTAHQSVYPSTSPFPLSPFSLTFPLHPRYSEVLSVPHMFWSVLSGTDQN